MAHTARGGLDWRGIRIADAITRHGDSSYLDHLGIVGVAGKLGSMIEVKRIPGRYFETSEQAEQHGLELAKQWVDDHAKDRSSE